MLPCNDCDHPQSDHKDAAGICLHEGCQCNLFRYGRRGVQEPLRIDLPDDVATVVELAPLQIELQEANHIPPDFIKALNEVFEAGIKEGRAPGDWKKLSPLAVAGKMRNLLVHLAHGEFVSVASNSMIMWWHLQREGKETNNAKNA